MWKIIFSAISTNKAKKPNIHLVIILVQNPTLRAFYLRALAYMHGIASV